MISLSSFVACLLLVLPRGGARAASVDIRAPSIAVPPNGTVYAYVPIKFSALNGSLHFVSFEPIVKTSVVHHILLYRCDATFSRAMHVSSQHDYERSSGLPRGCEMSFAWAPGTGAPLKSFPRGVGMRASAFMAIQLHYDSTHSSHAVIDTSGFRLHYSSPRPEELWMLRAGGGVRLFKPDGVAPAGHSAFFDTHACFMRSDRPMHAILASPHMHLTGMRMWTDVFRYNTTSRRVDKVAELGRRVMIAPIRISQATNSRRAHLHRSVDSYNFHAQIVLNLSVIVLPGDVLSTSCVYNTTASLPGGVRGGAATKDEMCYMFTMLWPDAGRCVWHASDDPSGVFAAASGDFPVTTPSINDSRRLYDFTSRRAGLVGKQHGVQLAQFMAIGQAPFDAEVPPRRAMSHSALLSLLLAVGAVAALVAALTLPHLNELCCTSINLLPHGDWRRWTTPTAGHVSRAAMATVVLMGVTANVIVSTRRYAAPFWLIYATHWTLLFTGASFVLGFAVSYRALQPCAQVKPPRFVTAWIVCQGVALPASILISLAFWVRVLATGHEPFLRPPMSYEHLPDTLQILMSHGGNALLLLYEHRHLNSFRSTLGQAACFIVTVAAYAAFTVLYFVCGGVDPNGRGRFIYPALRYDNPLYTAQTTVILVSLFVFTPSIALFQWLIERRWRGEVCCDSPFSEAIGG